jgi:hypothetical protein
MMQRRRMKGKMGKEPENSAHEHQMHAFVLGFL